jgi:tetratricopeptide (TPR) repeat protein/tRNA A-37 threonylcarbamoyl transferase component Bud32
LAGPPDAATSIESDLADGTRSEPGQPSSPTDPYVTHGWEPARDAAADPYATESSAETASLVDVKAISAAAVADWPTIPGYQIVGELGKGGMGLVYKARHLGLKRIVALKMIRDGAYASARDLARFRTEAEAVARLHHPHIVQIYDVGQFGGLPYFSLEFVPGGSLAHHLQGKPQPAPVAARIVEQLADGVQAAHECGIIHRDLKPSNVLLANDRTPKLTDFGLAKKLDGDSGQTHSGDVIGTPNYMAPEQASGNTREIGPSADIYALGAILYELLVGGPPFKGASLADTLQQVRFQEPVTPRRLQPKVPRDLETVCLKCLEKEPDRRYTTAQAVADDLRRFLTGEPIHARPVPAWERALKWARRRPAQAAAVAAVALALVAGAAGVAFYGLYQGQRARVAEQEMRLAQQELDEMRRQDEARDLVRQGQQAVAKEDWPHAQLQLTTALAKIPPNERALDELQSEAQTLLKEAERGLSRQRSQQEAQSRLAQFRKGRDDTLFLATSPASKDLAASLRATRDKARQTLAIWNVSIADRPPLTFGSHLGDRDKEEVLAGCYELLLILAEAEAQPLPEERRETRPEEALRTLDRASALGCAAHPTQAYHLRRARYLEALGQAEAALQEREWAAARPATMALDYYLVAYERFEQGQVEEALHDFDGVLTLQPDSFWAKYLQALCYLRTRRWESAKVGLIACLSQRPDSFWARLALATAFSQLREFSTAETHFGQVLAQAADDPARRAIALTNRGSMWIRQQRWDQAIADLRAAIAAQPDSPGPYISLALAYRGCKEWTTAVDVLDQAIQRLPNSSQLYRERALRQLDCGNPDAAKDDFENAIVRSAGVPPQEVADNYVRLGYLQYQAGEYEATLHACDEALKKQPDYLPAYGLRADVVMRWKGPAQAGEALDQYLRKKPERIALQTRALIHQELHQYPEAIEAYSRALLLKFDASKVSARAARQLPLLDVLCKLDAETLGYRGWAYVELDASQPALADFEVALGLDPANVNALCGRGHVRVRLGKVAEGLADLEAALGLDPANVNALCGRGYARVRLGRVKAGVEDVEAALAQGPPDQRLLLLSARICSLAAEQADVQPELGASPRAPAAYAERAIHLLHLALEQPRRDAQRKALWRSSVQNDRRFNPIRRRIEFQELALRYGS